MASEHDTEEHSGGPREKTDPAFPGPPSKPRSGTDPGFPPPSSPNQVAAAPANPHDIRVSDTLPAAPKAEATPAPKASVPPAAGTPSSPPTAQRPSSQPPPARSESIDELLEGLAGEGQLPRARKKDGAQQSSPPRAPAPRAETPDALPPVVIGPEVASPPAKMSSDAPPGAAGARDDETVLTPKAFQRKTRPGNIVAGVLGVVIALLLLAFVRRITREADPIPPVTTLSAATNATAPQTPPQSEGIEPALPSTAAPTEMTTGPAVVESAPPTKSAKPAPESSAPAKAIAPAPADSGLGDFQKTIRR